MAAITTRVTSASVAGAGTITCTTASPTVTGSGTSFTTAVTIGQQLYNSSNTYIGTVLTIDSNTQITLVSNAAVGVSAGAYNIVSTGITTKSSPLTNAEIDANFINLNNAVVAGANSSVNNTANTLVKRGPSGEFSAGAVTLTSVTTAGVTYPTTNATQAQMEAGSDATTRYMSPASIKQAIDVLANQGIGTITKDITGFANSSSSTLSWVDSTRTFTITPITSYDVYYRGKKLTISSTLSIVIPNVDGPVYIYIDPATSTLATSTSSATIFDQIVVAYVYWNTTAVKAVIVADERHGADRDTTWHKAQHTNNGMMWRSGGDITYTLNSDTTTTFALTSPIAVADEDLAFSISHNPTPTNYYTQILVGAASLPTIYLSGNYYTQTAESTNPWVAGTATARYNPISSNSGSISDAGEGKYISYWIIATNDMIRPIKAVMGRNAYSTVSAALAETLDEYGLPFAEVSVMYHVILLTKNSFTGNKVQIVNVRTVRINQSNIKQQFAATSHASLSNLADGDDHTQYVHVSNARTVSASNTYSGNNTFSGVNGFGRVTINDINSSVLPTANATYDLGSLAYAWRNVYTNDLHLSNEGHEEGNMVDGTKGNWTVQEGDSNLYIINNNSGKKYKFSLEEIK